MLADAPRAAVAELRAVFYAGMSSGLRMADDPGADLEALFTEIRDTMIEAHQQALAGSAWQREG